MSKKRKNNKRKNRRKPLKTGLIVFIAVFVITSVLLKVFIPNIKNSQFALFASSARGLVDRVSDDSIDSEEFVEKKDSIGSTDPIEPETALEAEEENKEVLEKETNSSSFDDIKLSSVAGPLKYYNQLDPRWKDLPFGSNTKFTIGTDACGPTVMATIVSSLTDNQFDPVSMTDWADQNGYLASGGGAFHSIVPGTAESFGLKVKALGIPTTEEILDELEAGNLIVELAGNGVFSDSTGHFIILIDSANDGSIYISDPAHVKNIYKKWDPQLLIDEGSRAAQEGGPFWAIGR